LLHEQFIISNFNRNILKERLLKNDTSRIIADMEVSPTMRTLGIFCSGSIKLQNNNSPMAAEFRSKIKASFRIIAFAKPDYLSALKSLLYAENFVEHNTVATVMNDFLLKFTELKNVSLYGSDEDAKAKSAELLDIKHIRLAIKLACLIRNQEYGSYFEKQLQDKERLRIEEYNKDTRECVVVWQDSEWVTKWKRKEEWIKDRQR
jgi:hypothetical protein